MRSTKSCHRYTVFLALITTLLHSGQVLSEVLEEQVRQCRAIADETARLACYDGLAPGEQPVDSNKEESAKSRDTEAASVSASGPSAAGTAATASSPGAAATGATAEFGKEHWRAEDSLETMESKVSVVQKGARGQIILLLENGQVWEQKDVRRLSIREGDTIIIERGSMNSFFIKEKGSSRLERFSRVR